MDSLFNILSDRIPDEPPEIRFVRGYIRQHFNENASVVTDKDTITVTVRSSSLAGTLRFRASTISKEMDKAIGKPRNGGKAKRFVFRIGQV